MNAQTCQLLLDAHNETQQWNSVLKVNHGSSIIDVSCPGNSIPEPTCGSIPDDCYYEFDPTIFRGIQSRDDLATFLQQACPGCTLNVMSSGRNPYDLFDSLNLRCQCYRIRKCAIDDNFSEGKFSQTDTVTETILKHKKPKQRSFARMDCKLKYAKKTSQKTRDTRTKPDDKTKRRCFGVQAETQKTRCYMRIKCVMRRNTGVWYLHKSTSLEHQFHARIPESCTSLNEDALDDKQREVMWELYSEGVGPSIVANVMTKIVNKKGKAGYFVPSRVKNITLRMQNAFDTISGLKGEYSTQAQRTIDRLNT